ncbi:Ras-related protein RABA5a [Mycena indigotica]|uniref:Ras-related protein RABA5a n=1 Tax=Mycena indigotica TaxID=2126181 RepID=A0A8H6T3S1_9AGAR|nr:Ras-related protein RABA5a [Mycena indigotica]KAF7310335.1 Ras-related protein RABA5a [Mycena indigotica]
MSSQEQTRLNIKILLVGDARTGKESRESLMRRFTENVFDPAHRDVGCTMRPLDIEGKHINAQIFTRPTWLVHPTPAIALIKPSFLSVGRFHVPSLYYYTSSVCIVYDVCQRHTFSQIEDRWLGEISRVQAEYLPPSPIPMRLYLVGNKTDREAEREVSTEEGAALAARCNMVFAETSALDGSGVEDLFMTVFTQICHDVDSTTRSEGWGCHIQ